MAENKGIVIDFYGNTVEFDKSVDGVNKALKSVKNELSTLNKQLKIDPTSIDNLQKKFNKLQEYQTVLSEKVDIFKNELANLNAEDVGSEQWNKLTTQLRNAQVELERVNKDLANMPNAKVQELSKQFENVEKTLNNVGSKIESVGKALAPLSALSTGLIAGGIKYNATLEQQTALFETLTGSVEEANRVLGNIKQDAMSTPFDTSSLISANQFLISAGEEADKSREVILDLANAISATGGGNAELQRMAQNLQQIYNNGKATTMDLRQFANAGINLFSILSDSTGKSVKELQEMDITYEMISKALSNASAEGGKYYGAMDKQAQTLTGQLMKLKAQFEVILGQLTEALMPIIQQVLNKVQELINWFTNLDDKQKELITRILLIVASLSPLLTIIGKLIGQNGLGGLAGSIAKLLKGEKLGKWFSTLASSGGSLGAVIKTLVSTIGKLINPITLVIGALALAYTQNEDFRNSINTLVGNLLDALKPAFETIMGVLKKLWETFKPVIKVGKDLAVLLGTTIGLAVNLLISMITNLINWLNTLFNKFKETSFGQAFIQTLNLIIDAVKTVIGWIGDLIGIFQKAINFGNQLLGISQATNNNAQKYEQTNVRTNRMIPMVASGGIGLTANIHINNNGNPIDEQEVNRWVEIMTSKLDTALGRRV